MIILIQNLGVDTVELFSRKQSKKLPCLIQRIFHGTVFIHSLADEFMLEFITEYQVLFIDRRKLILTDNGCQGTRISYLCIAGEQLVRYVLMIGSCVALTDTVHTDTFSLYSGLRV